MNKNIFGVFDKADIESFTNLITKLEESSFDYLKLEGQDVKIVIGKNGVSEFSEVTSTKAEVSSNGNGKGNINGSGVVAVESQIEDGNGKANTAPETEVVYNAKEDKEIKEQAGVVFITAPTAGLFYAQSEPGAPPYVRVGETVNKETTVGLIEIMKVFNAISAGVEGEIIEIHVENAEIVEPGQILMSVKVK